VGLPPLTFELFANHCHLAPSFGAGLVDRLEAHLDALGIARAVAFAPFAVEFDGDPHRANAWLVEQLAGRPRLEPFATVNPTHADAVSVLETMAGAGARGCKIHPSIDVYDLLDPRAMEFYAAASSLGILLDFHTGAHDSPLALSDPMKFDEILWANPELRVVLEHAGGRLYYELVLAIALNHPGRVLVGVTSVLERENNPLWYLGPERIEELVRILGGELLVFGLDFPWWPLEENRAALGQLLALDVAEEEKRKLLGGTLAAVLGRG